MSPEWLEFINKEAEKEHMIKLKEFLTQERASKIIYPSSTDVFNAFVWCPYDRLKVVIVGQDPYHTADTADGLAFSTQQPQTPKSLQIIIDEIWQDEMKQFHSQKGAFQNVFQMNDLRNWAVQGVLLLNTVLTVEKGKAGSHAKKGWEQFTANVLHWINTYEDPLVFMFWGSEAKKYAPLITNEKHLKLAAAHPAAEVHNPGHGGFTGCQHFSQANAFIAKTRHKYLNDPQQQPKHPQINWGIFPHWRISSHNQK